MKSQCDLSSSERIARGFRGSAKLPQASLRGREKGRLVTSRAIFQEQKKAKGRGWGGLLVLRGTGSCRGGERAGTWNSLAI